MSIKRKKQVKHQKNDHDVKIKYQKNVFYLLRNAMIIRID